MESRSKLFYCVLAAAVRPLLMNSGFQKVISERLEVSTALNSWKRGANFFFYLITMTHRDSLCDLFHFSPANSDRGGLSQKLWNRPLQRRLVP